jgi:hypothetical protein
MTQPQSAQQLPAVQMAAVISQADNAVLGHILADAGVSRDRMAAVLSKIEELAVQAARSVALGAAQALAQELRNVHQQAANEIARRMLARNPGGGVLNLHAQCVQIATDVANGRPFVAR